MIKRIVFILLALVISPSILSKPDLKGRVLVTGYAKSFVGDFRIANATIKILPDGYTIKTDNNGRFYFWVKPGQLITLELHRHDHSPFHNYQVTQIGTFKVPKEGYQGKHQELTFQVPRVAVYSLLKKIITAKTNISVDPRACQVATTITAFGKTLEDDPQGEQGAHLVVSQDGKILKNVKTIYFGILLDKTNPLVLNNNHSSLDGGALVVNLPASEKLYKISAIKPGKLFTSEYFYCRPGAFINLSPPHGVTALDP